MKLINLTPHTIVLDNERGERFVYPSQGVARVSSTPGLAMLSGGDEPIPVDIYKAPTWGAVEGLPAPEPGIWYLVSALVAQRLEGQGRRDVVSPGTGPNDGAIRENGQIIAVTRLIQAPQ